MHELLAMIRFIRVLQRLRDRSIANELELQKAEKELDELLKLDDAAVVKALRSRARTHTHTRAHIN